MSQTLLLRTSTCEAGAIFIILPWLAILFTTIGIAAGDFFSVNLGSIADNLRMSDTFAGVTLLVLENGAPDSFSSFAAISSGSTGLAYGELVGAACFITTAILGSMAFVTPFKIKKGPFSKDVSFPLVTAVYPLVILLQKEFYSWQSVTVVAFYAFHVIFVMIYHWIGQRTLEKKKNAELVETDDKNGTSNTCETSMLFPSPCKRLATNPVTD